ncbi:hypothetical protein RI054_16g77080 [Pseudoscourfieldia marina]
MANPLPSEFAEFAKVVEGKRARVLVTGGVGFIGQHVCSALHRLGLQVWYTHRSARAPPKSTSLQGCLPLAMDLEITESIEEAVRQAIPDIVVHCANMRGGASEADPSISEKPNLRGSEHLLDALDTFVGLGKYCFSFFSTDIVYAGEQVPGTPLEENLAEFRPLSVYAMHKLEVERLIMTRVPNYCIFRGPFVYGLPADHPADQAISGKGFFLDLLSKLKTGKTAELFVDEWRTPCFIHDLLDIVVRATFKFTAHPAAGGSRIFNLTSGHTLTRLEFGMAVCEAFSFDQNLLKPFALFTNEMKVQGMQRKTIPAVVLSTKIIRDELQVMGHTVHEALASLAKIYHAL